MHNLADLQLHIYLVSKIPSLKHFSSTMYSTCIIEYMQVDLRSIYIHVCRDGTDTPIILNK